MLTKKGKCRLKALVFLARSEPGKAIQVAEIAARQNISRKFLDAIMRNLKNAGFVRSWKGSAAASRSAGRRPRSSSAGGADARRIAAADRLYQPHRLPALRRL